MASEKNITMRQYNGVDYDTLYPKTKVEQVEGAYTQQQILSDSTKGLYGLGADAVPDDVFSLLKTLVTNAQSSANEKAKIETVSYVGTGVGGSEANATTLEVPEFAKIVVIVGFGNNSKSALGSGVFVKPNVVPSNFGYGGFGGYDTMRFYLTKWVNTTLSWYTSVTSNSDVNQLNDSNAIYVAYCIG